MQSQDTFPTSRVLTFYLKHMHTQLVRVSGSLGDRMAIGTKEETGGGGGGISK